MMTVNDTEQVREVLRRLPKKKDGTLAEVTSNGHKHTPKAIKAISEAKKGRNNPNYQGCYYIKGKRFYSLRSASRATGLVPMTISRRCKANKDKDYLFVPDPNRVL